MQGGCPYFIVIVSLAVVLHLGQCDPSWSTGYCPFEGCFRRCGHINQYIVGPDWCDFPDVRHVLGGDINNDGWCDILCVTVGGNFKINYRTPSNFSAPVGTYLKSTTFCQPSTGFHLAIRDINNDGYDDVICVNDDVPDDDQVRVSYITGKQDDVLSGVNETVTNATISAASLLSSINVKFSGKDRFKRAAECTKYQSQCSHVHYESIAPVVQGNSWCISGSLFAGDLNGDGYCDIVCQLHGNKRMFIMLYVADMREFVAPLDRQPAGYLTQLGSWCSSSSSVIRIIDVNFDGLADIVCGVSGLTATEPYQIDVIYGAPYNEPIAKTPADPIYVQSSQILQLGASDPVVSCVGCSKPAVANGILSYNSINKTYHLVCLSGYQIRGNPLVECIEGYYTSALPICQKMAFISNCHAFVGMSIHRKSSEQFVKQSALEPIEVASAANIGDCVRLCRLNVRCMNAELKGTACSLYEFEATKESLTASNDESTAILCG